MKKLENILIIQYIMKLIDVGRKYNICEKDVIRTYIQSIEEYQFENNPHTLHKLAHDKTHHYIISEGKLI